MEIDKIRNLNDAELTTQANQAAEQLFRLRFQKSLGNNDGVKKIQGLRKDIARFKTIARQRTLGLPVAKKEKAEAAPVAKKAAAPKKVAAKKATAAKKAPAKKAEKE